MKKTFTLLFFLLISFTLVGCQKEKEFDFEKGFITIGLEADYPPFNWAENEANDYNYPLEGHKNLFVAGYDVLVAKHLAKELDLDLKIKMIPWESLVVALKTNQIDLIIAGMSPTKERLESIDFTNSYYNVNHVIVTKKDSPFSTIKSLDDLNGAIGIGQLGTIYDDLVSYVEKNHGASRLPALNTTPEITRAILSEVADFTIVEKPVALGMIKNNPSLQISFESDENVFNLSDEDRLISAGVRKIDVNLKNKINSILNSITDDQKEQWMEFSNSIILS